MRRLERVKDVPRERLEALSEWLASRVVKLLEEALEDKARDVGVCVNISDEWPYTVEVEALVGSDCVSEGLGDLLEKVLEQALSEFIRKALEEGLEPLG